MNGREDSYDHYLYLKRIRAMEDDVSKWFDESDPVLERVIENDSWGVEDLPERIVERFREIAKKHPGHVAGTVYTLFGYQVREEVWTESNS
jgi:hypothetical protein